MSFEEEKLEEDRRKNIRGFHFQIYYSFSLYVFLSFDGLNSFSRDDLVYFLRSKM